jgi:hypothetical protein
LPLKKAFDGANMDKAVKNALPKAAQPSKKRRSSFKPRKEGKTDSQNFRHASEPEILPVIG